MSPQPAQQQHPAEERFCHGPSGRLTDPEAMQPHKRLTDRLNHSTGSSRVLVRPINTLRGPLCLANPELLLVLILRQHHKGGRIKTVLSLLQKTEAVRSRHDSESPAADLSILPEPPVPALWECHAQGCGEAGCRCSSTSASPPRAGERELRRSAAPGELRAGSRLPRNPCAKSVQ